MALRPWLLVPLTVAVLGAAVATCETGWGVCSQCGSRVRWSAWGVAVPFGGRNAGRFARSESVDPSTAARRWFGPDHAHTALQIGSVSSRRPPFLLSGSIG